MLRNHYTRLVVALLVSISAHGALVVFAGASESATKACARMPQPKRYTVRLQSDAYGQIVPVPEAASSFDWAYATPVHVQAKPLSSVIYRPSTLRPRPARPNGGSSVAPRPSTRPRPKSPKLLEMTVSSVGLGSSGALDATGSDLRTQPSQRDALSNAGSGAPPNQFTFLKMQKPCYPRRAQEKGLEGFVKVVYLVGPGGHPQDIQLVKSSGVRSLDKAALSAARKDVIDPEGASGKRVERVYCFRLTSS